MNDELVWSEEYTDPQSYENVEVFVSQPNWDAADTKVKDLYVKSIQFWIVHILFQAWFCKLIPQQLLS